MQPFPQSDPAPTNAGHTAAPHGESPISKMPEYAYRAAIVVAVLLLLWTAA